MREGTWTLVGLSLALALAMGATLGFASQASAYYCTGYGRSYFLGGHSCGDTGNYHKHYEVYAHYPGSGTVRVRTNFWNGSFGSYAVNYGYNWTGSRLGGTLYWNLARSCNASDWAHTINQAANYCVFGKPGEPDRTLVTPQPSDAAAQRELMEVLRREATAEDVLPQEIFEQPSARELSWDRAGTRLALRDESNASYFVIPGALTCLLRQTALGDYSSTCNRTGAMADGLVMLEQEAMDDLPAGMVRLAGLARDGVASVRVRIAPESAPVSVEVVHNAWVVETEGTADTEPAEVTFVTTAGTEQTVLPRAEDAPEELESAAAIAEPIADVAQGAGGCAVGHRPSTEWMLVPVAALGAVCSRLRRRSRRISKCA